MANADPAIAGIKNASHATSSALPYRALPTVNAPLIYALKAFANLSLTATQAKSSTIPP